MVKAKRVTWGITVCAIASSFYIYDYILRVMPEAMTHGLMSAFNVQEGKLGILASLFFWGYAPMQIPVGILFDRYSARLLLSLTLLLSSLAALGFGYAEHYAVASFYRFLMGVMTSFAFIGALVVGARWFKGRHFALYTGLVQFLGCMGAIIGIAPVAIISLHYGWREASLWIAALGFLLTLLVWLVVRDTPKQLNPSIAEESESLVKSQRAYYKEAFSNPQTWWVGLYGFAIWAPITVFAVLWGVPFFRETYHLSVVDASNKISIIWLTIGVAGPIIGWLSKRVANRKLLMIGCALTGSAASSILILCTRLSTVDISLLLVGFGIGASGLVLAFGLVVDIQHPKAAGIVIGFTNMTVILGGLLLQPLVGFILEIEGHGRPLNHVMIYSHHTYELALLMVPASFLLALITTFFVRETHTQMAHCYGLEV